MIKIEVEYLKQPVLVPVTAEDVLRRRLRIVVSGALALAVAAGGIGFALKRSVDGVHARESYDAGMRLLAIANYNQAVLAFDRAAGLKPHFADAYLMRGKAYAGDSKTDEAIRDFTRFIELEPKDSRGRVARAAAFLDLKKYSQTMEDASRAIELDGRVAAAYNLRGLALRAMGDPRRAIGDFNHAVELEPNEDNYYQRAATYQMLNEHALAITDLNRVVAIRPDAPPAYLARAESRRAIGDYEGARMDETRAGQIEGR
jgi:tetratricopeptide (TPR) repeat protein